MAEKKKGLLQEFTKGIIKENPVLRLVLGCCATLAVTTAASNAIGMGPPPPLCWCAPTR